MKKSIFILSTLCFLNFAQASLPAHDVLEAKKEVWMIPVIQIHHTLWLDSLSKGTFIQSRMNPYASPKNTEQMIELKKAFPEYTIKIYRSELREAKLKLENLSETDYEYYPMQNGWMGMVQELKIVNYLVPQVQNALATSSQVQLKVSILRNDHFEEVIPEIDYELKTINF